MELEFLDWVMNNLPSSRSSLIGNGDDCAVMDTGNRSVLLATDMLLDGTHFWAERIQPELLGRKAVAVNFSDIAAMGGTPTGIFISLAIPNECNTDWLKRVMMGAKALANEFGCGIDGGDTNSWSGKFAINICVTGTPHWRGPVTRQNALIGDSILVTGSSLGGSLQSGRHTTFTPRVNEATWILDHFPVHSMIDISDGLATDARRLSSASKKRFILDPKSICPLGISDPGFKAAFCDGEDFELLFTCSKETAEELLRKFPWPCGVRKIGTVDSGHGVYLQSEPTEPLTPLEFSGFEH